MICQCLCGNHRSIITYISTVGFFLQKTLKDMKDYVATSADDNGNLWCHLEGCKDTYTPYRVNVCVGGASEHLTRTGRTGARW